MLRRDVETVLRANAGNGNIREVEGLRINLAVDHQLTELAELGLVHVGGCERCLIQVLAGPQIVVVIGRDVDRGRRWSGRRARAASRASGTPTRCPRKNHKKSGAELGSTPAEIDMSGEAAFVSADLPRALECAQVVVASRKKFHRVDILINNAGHYGPVVPVEEYPLAEFDNVIAVHLRAAFLLSQLVLPEMYARGSGVLLNISSLSPKSAFPWGSAYAAAKAGILGLTRVTAAEAARKGVRVNALCPGPVTETLMSKKLD